MVQVVFNPELTPEVHERAGDLRSEFVLAVRGKIRPRPEGTANPSMKTGDWEIVAEDFLLLSPAAPFPLKFPRPLTGLTRTSGCATGILISAG